ncbi:MAG: AarF/ABC1/UbiB kinase family protein [Gemmatimonadetes bacterium]|nr:AarF/ABC1/UbiB kinase family protein [Gemmatimonadota bacterium]
MRTLRIILALGPYVVSFFRDRRRWLWWGAPVVRTPPFHARRARGLVAAITALGPTFVKLAQVFASRADLIPEPYLGELGVLVDAVPPFPVSEVDRIVSESYDGARPEQIFETFNRIPVAAASLGQVHRATHRGRDVAVKILRPGIERIIERDLAAARRILGWVNRRWTHPHAMGLLAVVEEFSARIHEELDFRLEAEFAEEIGRNFAGNRDVVIPRVVHELTRQRVLVLDFIEGTRIDKLRPDQVQVKRLVQTLVAVYVQMMLVDGLFHADPHPGNLMVTDDGRLVLLDFGMVVRVEQATRGVLTRTVLAAIRRDPQGVAAGFQALGLVIPGTSDEVVHRLAELLIVNAFGKTTTQQRIDALLADRVMKTLYDFPIQLPRDMVYFARTAALIEGVGTKYDPYFQAIPIASPVVLRMRTRILRSVGEAAQPTPEEIATVAGYTLGKAARWVVDSLESVRAKFPTRASSMRSIPPASTTIVAALAAVTLAAAPRLAPAQSAATAGATAPGSALPSVEQQVAAAVLPLPKDLQAGATVMGYRSKDKLEVIRQGKNGMTCLALYVTRPDFHVACYHKSLEPFMSRGRELTAAGVKDPQRDSVRFREIKSGKLKMPAVGALYTLTGKKEDYDAATNKLSRARPLSVVYIPYATPESVGVSAVPLPDQPWIMFPGTPKAHIMIVGSMTP